MIAVYQLNFPDKFYIGSSGNFNSRKNSHLNTLQRGKHKNSNVQKEFDKLNNYDHYPNFLILKEISYQKDKEFETIYAIRKYEQFFINKILSGNQSENLLNSTLEVKLPYSSIPIEDVLINDEEFIRCKKLFLQKNLRFISLVAEKILEKNLKFISTNSKI